MKERSFRIGAIWRCCVRYGKNQDWAAHHLNRIGCPNLAGIWFRPRAGGRSSIDNAREEYREHLAKRPMRPVEIAASPNWARF